MNIFLRCPINVNKYIDCIERRNTFSLHKANKLIITTMANVKAIHHITRALIYLRYMIECAKLQDGFIVRV